LFEIKKFEIKKFEIKKVEFKHGLSRKTRIHTDFLFGMLVGF